MRPLMKARVEQALRELALAESDIAAVAARLLDSSPLLQPSRQLSLDSQYFDFRGKVTALVEHFADQGLTLSVYLQAVIRRPSLFSQSPSTLIGNIEAVAHH